MEDLQGNSSASSFSCCYATGLLPLHYDSELWVMAEERIDEVLCVIQPTHVSDRSRKEIIDYVRMLIKSYYGIEVFPFGSVPLKTYLPDGDIDLTVIASEDSDDLAKSLCCVLEDEAKGSNFQLSDVTYVNAQVKVIKCTIKNIAVDISFNQVAGICSLDFLEQADRLMGNNHLLKRSIVLVKAWFFYESRILGAHTGLMSTYAVSILVLYVINRFHSYLSHPLTVLYKFLDYYSTFDWKTLGVTINGPVPISSLQKLQGSIDNGTDGLFLSQEFLRQFRSVCAVPRGGAEANSHCFPVKHFNIVDPLRNNNNLGRSVTQGNFFRIRSALALGAQRLREILMQPGEIMGTKLENFFFNALERNGKGQRPDVHETVAAFGTGRSEPCDLTADYDGCYPTIVYGRWHNNQSFGPLLTSETFNENIWEITHDFAAYTGNTFQGATNMMNVPRMLSSQPRPPHLALTFEFCGNGRSRGTGTYIPKTNLLAHRSNRLHPSTRNANLGADHVLPESTNQSYNDEDLPEAIHAGNRDARMESQDATS